MADDEEAGPNPQKPYDASDADQLRQARRELAARASPQQLALQRAMGDKDFRTWMAGLLSACHRNSPVFSTDAQQTAFLCGEHNVGLRIVGDLTSACPELYVSMMMENGSAP